MISPRSQQRESAELVFLKCCLYWTVSYRHGRKIFEFQVSIVVSWREKQEKAGLGGGVTDRVGRMAGNDRVRFFSDSP